MKYWLGATNGSWCNFRQVTRMDVRYDLASDKFIAVASLTDGSELAMVGEFDTHDRAAYHITNLLQGMHDLMYPRVVKDDVE